MFCLSGVLVSLLAHLFPRKPKDVVRAERLLSLKVCITKKSTFHR